MAVSLTGCSSRRSARAAESARLEIVCGATHRGFKSHLLRHMTTPELSRDPAADDGLMRLAIAEAQRAEDHGDVPVGALVVVDGAVIASRHNERERSQDPTAHAEILALRDAAARMGTWRLEAATLVVTLEPCPMCAGALVSARVERVVYGAADPKAGACGTLYNLCADPRLNHETVVTGGVLADECGSLLRAFFSGRR